MYKYNAWFIGGLGYQIVGRSDVDISLLLIYNSISLSFSFQQSREYKLFQSVCRGEYENVYLSNQKLLSCKYHTNNNPYLLLQPYKMEQLSLDPYIISVYDILTEHQMEVVKKLATPYMERSEVFKPNTDGVIEKTDARTSKTAWFRYYHHKYLDRMRQHVTDITGLDYSNSEDLQIVNYGMGGHYNPHFDFFMVIIWDELKFKNKMY